MIAAKLSAVDFLSKMVDDRTLVESDVHSSWMSLFAKVDRQADRDARLAQLTRCEREVMEKMRAIASLPAWRVRTIEGYRASVMKEMHTGKLLHLLQLVAMK